MTGPRCWLFVPGDSARKIERALAGEADALIFDWEDAVAPAAKAAAREITLAALAASAAPAGRCWIRVNALDSPHFDADIAQLPVASVAGVVLPKACGIADLERLGRALAASERTAGVSAGHLGIVAIVTETAASVLALSEFRRPLPRLEAMMWGGEDLAGDLGVARNRDDAGAYRAPFQLARNLMLLAAAAAECSAIDAVRVDYAELDALAVESAQARDDGFTAKAAIHPAQVAPIQRSFTPSPAELEWARRVVAALAEGGLGVVDGRMVDAPHLRLARRILS
ncbi:MAG: CoA ester lyase [Variovorax sp.]|nr:MAG: CoA ester lyase [Variovorax sp.]